MERDEFHEIEQAINGEARGARHNAGKWVPTFWPREALEAGSRVWEYGARKYARDNWRGGMPWTEVADSALRHLHAWLDGEDVDEESGLSHVWHALCNLAMLCWFIARRPDLDDRFRNEAASECPSILLMGPRSPAIRCSLPSGHPGNHVGGGGGEHQW